jgi:hypothetical protein
MQKSDESIRNICVASIKRHTIRPIDYPLTKVFESQVLADIDNIISSAFRHLENELPIALIKVDNNNWTLLTTRQIISNINGEIKQALKEVVTHWKWNDFKDNKNQSTTLGQLTLNGNATIDILIETGKASMIMIYGIMTLTGLVTRGK